MSEQASGEKAMENPFDISEVCNKMRAGYTERMAEVDEISKQFVAMGRKNAELSEEVEAAKKEVAAAKEIAVEWIKAYGELSNRADKAEKALKEYWEGNGRF